MKFRHFVAQADLSELNVAVYGEDNSEIRVLKVHNSRTQKESMPRRISKTEYAALREIWEKDLPNADGNVVTTQRAIEWMKEQSTNHPNRRKPLTDFSPAALQDLRKSAGWTQAECAAEIHSTRRTLQDWENGVAAMHPGLWELLHIKAKRKSVKQRPADAHPGNGG